MTNIQLSDTEITEIYNKTKIPVEYLQAIITKDFHKLKNTNLKAYLQIIGREYNVDLSDYLYEFESFIAQNYSKDRKIQVKPRLPGYRTKDKYGAFFWFIVVLLIIGIIIWGVKIISGFNFKHFLFSQKTEQNLKVPSIKLPEIKDSDTTISINIAEANVVEKKLDSMETNIQKIQENTKPAEKNIEKVEKVEKVETIEKVEPQKTAKPATENRNFVNSDERTQHFIADNTKPLTPDMIRIKPIKDVWVGIKDLKTLEKSAFTAQEAVAFDINVSGTILIAMGHGEVDVEFFDHNESFRQPNPLRFLVTNGKARKIQFNEYLQINKGREW